MRIDRLLWTASVALILCSLPVVSGGQAIQLIAPEVLRVFDPLVTDVLRDAGFSPKTRFVPQARLFTEYNRGGYDAAWFLTDSGIAKLTDAIRIPVVLYSAEFVAVTLKPSPRITRREDLRSLRVAINLGNRAAIDITRGVAKLELNTDQVAMFRMLASGRVDAVVTVRAAVPGFAKSAGLLSYHIQEPSLATFPYYLVLSRSTALWENRITQAFRTAVDEGYWGQGLAAGIDAMNQAGTNGPLHE